MAKAAVIMGSDSDWGVMQAAVKTLKSFGIEVETHIMSAHRTPAVAGEFAENAYKNGFGVIIAAAGKAAHLAGAIAGHTILPVIGVPLCSGESGWHGCFAGHSADASGHSGSNHGGGRCQKCRFDGGADFSGRPARAVGQAFCLQKGNGRRRGAKRRKNPTISQRAIII